MLKFCPNCGAPANVTALASGYYCTPCQTMHYRNPIPVVVGLVRCYRKPNSGSQYGILLVRRVRDQKWALPGGFVDLNDLNWKAALSREVKEEAGLIVEPRWSIEGVETATDRNILIFASADKAMQYAGDVPPENPETDALRLAMVPEELAFPMHSKYLRDYLSM